MNTVLKEIRAGLARAGSDEVRESAGRFFKGDEKKGIRLHGVKSADVRALGKTAIAALRSADKDEVFAICEALWKSGYLEEGGVACELAYSRRREFTPSDLDVFSGWIDRYVGNWASCDTLCNHSVGTVVEMYPELVETLKSWADSDNRWKKRAAAVSLIIPARNGLFLEDVFAIADRLLADPDDMVQKGYGWMLKAAGEAHPEKIFAYVLARRATMPRTAFRYAIEKLPKDMRAQAMKK